MPLDPNSINTSIRSVLVALYGLDPKNVRPANQNAPTGNQADPFATVLITDCEPVGQDVRTITDDQVAHQLTETIEGQRHVICDVQFFRASAYSNASRLRALMHSSAAMMLLQANGLGFIRCGTARNINEIVDTYDEERAQVQVEFYFSATETLVVSTLASVAITLQTETQSITREVNLDVNS